MSLGTRGGIDASFRTRATIVFGMSSRRIGCSCTRIEASQAGDDVKVLELLMPAPRDQPRVCARPMDWRPYATALRQFATDNVLGAVGVAEWSHRAHSRALSGSGAPGVNHDLRGLFCFDRVAPTAQKVTKRVARMPKRAGILRLQHDIAHLGGVGRVALVSRPGYLECRCCAWRHKQVGYGRSHA
jgi:hypothetical protein